MLRPILIAGIFLAPLVAEPPILPKPTLTPGAIVSTATKSTICVPGYSASIKEVTGAVRAAAFVQYGLSSSPAVGQMYELDRLIPLSLGGSNAPKNLWPQSRSGIWNSSVKDSLENQLHEMVCGGILTLQDAQQGIAADWIAEYKKIFQTDHPVHPPSRRAIKHPL